MYPPARPSVNPRSTRTHQTMRDEPSSSATPPAPEPAAGDTPEATTRLQEWAGAWRRSGRIVLLLDFDGTLAPIVPRPEDAAMSAATRRAIERLRGRGAEVAIVSGRGMADARERAGIDGIAYAGNHGMEIEGAGIRRIHAEAVSARPALQRIHDRVAAALTRFEGAWVEDKGLTLSVHYRQAPAHADDVREAVFSAVRGEPQLRTSEGKAVVEVRPRVDWDKGRAVEFLLEQLDPAPGVPVLYLGDDVTDEDAFTALRSRGAGDGIVVADPPPARTAATAWLRDTMAVSDFLEALAEHGPGGE